MKPVCFNCPDRWVNEEGRCHDSCDKYKAEHEKTENAAANKRKEKDSIYKSKNYEKKIGRM